MHFFDSIDNASDGLGRKQAWRAAAHEYGGNGSTRDEITAQLQLALDIRQQSIDVGALAERLTQRVGIEVAVRALADTPREVQIKTQWNGRRV